MHYFAILGNDKFATGQRNPFIRRNGDTCKHHDVLM